MWICHSHQLLFTNSYYCESALVAWLTQRFLNHVPECTRKTKEVLNDKCGRMESKRKKLLRSHAKEKSNILELREAEGDMQQFTKVRTFCLPVL